MSIPRNYLVFFFGWVAKKKNKPPRDFHRRMVALAASGFNKKRALLDKALEEPWSRFSLVLTTGCAG